MRNRRRIVIGGSVYHVCNRGSRKGELFEGCEDYDAFERLMEDARQKTGMRVLAYHLMRNHFHFLLWPRESDDLQNYMQWLTSTHAKRWHRHRNSAGTGAVYQSRYTAIAVRDERQLLTVWRYVERNALAAGLVNRAEDWRWSSAPRPSGPPSGFTVDPCPFKLPDNWLDFLNE